MTGSNLTTNLSRFSVPITSTPASGDCLVAGTYSVTSSITNSPIPVPNTAELRIHSAILLLALVKCISSSNCVRISCMSSFLTSCASSLISKNLPRPNVASSTSATADSTACCVAGEIILERSESRILSDLSQIPRQIR